MEYSQYLMRRSEIKKKNPNIPNVVELCAFLKIEPEVLKNELLLLLNDDVPIPPKEGEKTPCKRCVEMQFPDDELHIIKSIENGAMSDDEAKAVLMAVAMKKSRLHKECAESIVPVIIDRAKKHKTSWY